MKFLVYSIGRKRWNLIEAYSEEVEEKINKGIRDGETSLILGESWRILDELPPSIEPSEDIPLFVYGEPEGMNMSIFYLKR